MLIRRLLTVFIVLNILLPAERAAATEHAVSSMLSGPIGLNMVPSARMAPTGTVSFGVSTLDPYVHGYLGFQIAKPLSITLRQTAEISNINEDADRLFPGVDFKLRLIEESKLMPEIAVGLQSTIGHKRMAGEYLALSKRYNNFDFTLGLGWGRYGSAGHIKNPLKIFGAHFKQPRSADGELPNEPDEWFTGESVGIFGGVEYFTALDGVSVKLDIGADRYEAERTALGFDAPTPWTASVVYQPTDWIDLSFGTQGGKKLLGRLSVQSPIQKWPLSAYSDKAPMHLRPYRTDLALPGQMENSAQRHDVSLYDAQMDGLHKTSAHLALAPHIPTPKQIGHAARHMANHAGPATEEIEITPTIFNLRGPSVRLMRRDLEMAIAKKQGSPEEIWHNAEFGKAPHDPKRILTTEFRPRDLHLLLDNTFSLSEEDHGVLYRTSLIGETRFPHFYGLLTGGAALRLDIKDNLEKLNVFRPRALLPVRSNIDDFADNALSIDRAYLSATHSLSPTLHGALSWGYLEEMYAGLGGEILYRPFESRFAVGAELWQVFKRDPDTSLELGFNGDHVMSGHLKAWYDVPEWDVTLGLKAGRYLAEDIGATISLTKQFDNGAALNAFSTISDQADFDVFGGTTHVFHGISLSLPLGGHKDRRQWASARLNAQPLGRDIGQAIDNPMPLYEITEPFSARHMIQHWGKVTE